MESTGAPRFNAWPLAGAVLGLFGLLSYFLLFARFPMLRDTAALNLALVGLGVAAGGWGLRRALRRGGWLRVAGSAAAFLVAAGCAGLLGVYVFSLSRSLPAPTERTRSLRTAPGFELAAQDGTRHRLEELRGRNVLIVFYRGWW